MDILDYATLIQFSAGITVVFVAVEYTKSYTTLLSHTIFNLPALIEQSFTRFADFVDKSKKLETVPPEFKIGEISAFEYAEELNVRCGKFYVTVTARKSAVNTNADELCLGRSFSSICLWLFLYCVVLMFSMGVESIVSRSLLEAFLCAMCICTFLFIFGGWCFDKPIKYLDYGSKKHAVNWFIGAFVFSVVIGLVAYIFLDSNFIAVLYKYMVIPMVLWPYLNFVVYFYITKHKVSTIRKAIKTEVDDLALQLKSLEKEVDDILASLQAHTKILQNKETKKEKTPKEKTLETPKK
ncbi:hypothetical protein [Alistipes onderdonkii]|uniref:hypothetical protein n=1 Tax=Alistipes onderdonkii TaxID=328813 RepID=UPI0018747228|nr:hypothetical protein [Alistipes onderdonkii]MBE5048657.1 hypothetical protein [Alistipes onderdonkii]